MDYLLSTDNLTKTYKNYKAVNEVSLHIKKGDIYAFIGRNGAGKTTLLKMISGLAHPTSGAFTLLGCTEQEIIKNHVFSRVGTLIEAPGLYPNMTAFDNLKLKCMCIGINSKDYIVDLLELVNLESAGKKKAKDFSLGMKQRLGIAMALIGEPDLLVLDEPINGLDPQGIAEVRDTILKLNREKNITIIISSHILEELSKVSTTYGIIHEGKLLLELSKEQLMAKCSEKIEIKLEQPDQASVVLDRMGFTNYKIVDKETMHIYERLNESADINTNLVKADIRVRSITVNNEALEDFFFELTGGAKHV